jgi:hypothetical protein
MAVDQHGALIGVAVAGKHQIDAVKLQQGHRILAHVEHAPATVPYVVGIVRALGVGRVVPEGDHPFGIGSKEVVFQPFQHGAADGAVAVMGIEADEMHIAVVEGIIKLAARGIAADFARRRQREDIEIGRAVGTVVIAHGGPQGHAPQH